MAVLNIGDAQILLETVQRTSPSLKVMDESGQIYYVFVREGDIPGSLKISDGAKTYTVGDSSLFFSAASINSCDTVTLPAGRYGVKVVGGRGGDGGNNPGSGADSVVQTYSFTLDAETTATYFRGGNGNAGTFNSNSVVDSGGGGGASGADSLFYINGIATIAVGGNGGIGGNATNYDGAIQVCGAGGAGGVSAESDGGVGIVAGSLDSSFELCGAGGGGAPYGKGGAGDSSGSYRGEAGTDATDSNGGNGGRAVRILSNTAGGTGGATVTYSCAGQTLYSYGGGGGGAINTGAWSTRNAKGGNGGSGTSSTESAGVIEIYKYED